MLRLHATDGYRWSLSGVRRVAPGNRVQTHNKVKDTNTHTHTRVCVHIKDPHTSFQQTSFLACCCLFLPKVFFRGVLDAWAHLDSRWGAQLVFPPAPHEWRRRRWMLDCNVCKHTITLVPARGGRKKRPSGGFGKLKRVQMELDSCLISK